MFNKIKEKLNKNKLEKLYKKKLIKDFKNIYLLPKYNTNGSKIKWNIWVEKDGEYDIYTGEFLGEYNIYLNKCWGEYYKYNKETNTLDDVTSKFIEPDYNYD